MVSERVVGGLILAVFLVILVVFTLLMWYPPLSGYSILAMKIVDWVLVVGVSAVAIWLGWVMVSTKPIVPEEKPLEPTTQNPTATETQTGTQEKAGGTKPQEKS